MITDHIRFMSLAIDEAKQAAQKGDYAVGTVIVRSGEVVARGANLVNTTHDITDHAEVVAIRRACQNLGLLDFAGFALYTTFEPCPMCAGAILWGNFSRLVVGSRYATFKLRHHYRVEHLRDMVGSPLEIIGSALEAECDALANW
jgi:tRNA(adenine34) deaminase